VTVAAPLSPGKTGQITGSLVAITAAAMSSALMSVLDISIVNVGLSDIRASFGTPLDQIAWVSTGYAMANITVIPMSGWLQRRFGIRNTLTVAILLFTASSVMCGLSWNLPALVIFRIIQGLGGGAIIPTAQATLFGRFPREQAGMAGALFALGAITGPLLGPTVGGLLIDNLSWHWMFYVNVPIGLLGAGLAWTFIREEGFEPDQRPIDATGALLLGLGMVSLQYALEEGNRDGWLESPLITAMLATAVISLITFGVHVLEVDNPIVDLRVFKSRAYSAATALNCLIGTVLFGGSFLYSLYCGSIMHYRALDIGLIFLRGSWIQLFLLPIIGRNIGKVDSRYLIFFGLCGVTLSTVLNAKLTPAADTFTMTVPIFVRAVALSFCFVPLTVVALSGLSPKDRGSATGLFNATRELGGSIGTAWMSSRLTVNAKVHLTYLSEHVDAYSQTAQEQLRTLTGNFAGRVADPLGAAYGALSGRLNLQALSMAFSDGFTTLALLFLISLVVVFFLAKPDAKVDTSAAH
jgi:MFS transporter, DHA2 family, multidrug resistance protein